MAPITPFLLDIADELSPLLHEASTVAAAASTASTAMGRAGNFDIGFLPLGECVAASGVRAITIGAACYSGVTVGLCRCKSAKSVPRTGHRGDILGMILRALIVTTAFLAAGCTPAKTVTPAPVAEVRAVRQLPNDVRWVRTSAEYRALTRQAYAVATDRLPALARTLAAGSWAVILDADETVLDNSEYQRRLAIADSAFSQRSWTAWVNERAASAIAGAPEFTARVHALGGRVVIVTNRAIAVCDVTKDNLRSVGIVTDLVLCQPPGESDKNPRFQRVEQGTAAPGVPAMTVVEWIGDNVLDFPGLSQRSRADSTALRAFGARFFILPNPMYGSWEHPH
jgi:5'-nucleotidase (lipoprotein e(P4) family)